MYLPIAQSRANQLDINAYSGIAGIGRGFSIDVLRVWSIFIGSWDRCILNFQCEKRLYPILREKQKILSYHFWGWTKGKFNDYFTPKKYVSYNFLHRSKPPMNIDQSLTTRRNLTIIPPYRRVHRITPRLEREIWNKLSAIIVIKVWEPVISNMWRVWRPALACYASVSDVHRSTIIETKWVCQAF